MPSNGMLIETAKIRGVTSHGMLCSAHDLGWLPEPDGVLAELPDHASPGNICPATPMKVCLVPCVASSRTAATSMPRSDAPVRCRSRWNPFHTHCMAIWRALQLRSVSAIPSSRAAADSIEIVCQGAIFGSAASNGPGDSQKAAKGGKKKKKGGGFPDLSEYALDDPQPSSTSVPDPEPEAADQPSSSGRASSNPTAEAESVQVNGIPQSGSKARRKGKKWAAAHAAAGAFAALGLEDEDDVAAAAADDVRTAQQSALRCHPLCPADALPQCSMAATGGCQ